MQLPPNHKIILTVQVQPWRCMRIWRIVGSLLWGQEGLRFVNIGTVTSPPRAVPMLIRRKIETSAGYKQI